MKHSEDTFSSTDGLQLYFQTWLPDESMKALIVLVHGFNDHSGRYSNLINHMVTKGIGICGYDLRGHGRSQGKRGHVQEWVFFRNDLQRFLDKTYLTYPETPIILMGHSMGGLIVLNYLIHHPEEKISMVITSSPLMAQPDISPLVVLISKILSRIWPAFSVNARLNKTVLSRNPEVITAYQEDPLIHDTGTARLGTELTKTIDWTQAHAQNFSQPLLMYHGDADALVPIEGTQLFFKNAGSATKDLYIYPGGFHELHNDLDYKQVFSDLTNWIDKQL
jgi:alpha-beta hydrolase superfamily lysophospholipase